MFLFGPIWYWLQKIPNSTPCTILDRLSVLFTQLTIGQTFNSTGRPFFWNQFKWTCFYLERFGFDWKKLQKVQFQTIFDNIWIFFIQSTIGQAFNFTGWSFSRVNSYEVCLLFKGDRILREKLVVLAAKCSKEGKSKHFWQMFNFFLLSRPFCQNWFKWTVPPLQGWSNPQSNQVLAVKSSKEYTPKHVWQVYSFFLLSLL